MDAPEPPRPPWHLWVVGLLGLAWNAVGTFDFFMIQVQNEASMARFTPDQIGVLLNLPTWLVAMWALAVCGGLLGAGLLLARNRFADPVLLVSLLAMSATALHNVISPGGIYATGGTSPAFVLLIFVVAFGLWRYARTMRHRSVRARLLVTDFGSRLVHGPCPRNGTA